VSVTRDDEGGGLVKLAGPHNFTAKVSGAVYAKLTAMHAAAAEARGGGGGGRRADESVFALLVRYAAAAGGQMHEKRGGGMQASLPPDVFKALAKRLGCGGELFASALNALGVAEGLSGFGCAFDADAPFGGRGSCLHGHAGMRLVRGVYEANPPFVPEIMTQMAARFEAALAAAAEAGEPLSFVVVVPSLGGAGAGAGTGAGAGGQRAAPSLLCMVCARARAARERRSR